MERGIATSVLVVIVIVIGIAIGVGITYAITPQAPAGQPAKLSMGVVMWWHHDEGTWSPSHAHAIESVAPKYNIEYTWIEETGIQDVQSVIEQAATTYNIVYIETDEFMEAVLNVAPHHPDVYFIQEWETGPIAESGYDLPNNVVCINAMNAHQVNYLLGSAAAMLSKTGKLGVILAIPGPRSYRVVANAFREGARHVNPGIDVTMVEMNSYSDPAKARDTVASFDEAGIDVVFVNQDDFAATLEAAVRGMYTAQQYIDIVPYYPDVVYGCGIWDWSKALDTILNSIKSGNWNTFRAQHAEVLLSLEDGSLGIPTWGNMVSQDIKDYVAGLKEDIINGAVVVPEITTWTP